MRPVCSNKGFVTIWGLLLLPVLITLCILSARWVGWATYERETQMACQSELAMGQKKVSQIIENLLAINSKIRAAKTLRVTGYATIAAGVASYNAILVTQGEQMVELATKTLNALAQLQKVLISSGQLVMNQTLLASHQSVLQVQSDQARKQSHSLQNIEAHINPLIFKKIAVRPSNKDIDYPEYELAEPFESLQSLSISWKTLFSTTKDNSVWSKLNWKTSQICAVTLTERKETPGKIQVRLNLDKPLWNF